MRFFTGGKKRFDALLRLMGPIFAMGNNEVGGVSAEKAALAELSTKLSGLLPACNATRPI